MKNGYALNELGWLYARYIYALNWKPGVASIDDKNQSWYYWDDQTVLPQEIIDEFNRREESKLSIQHHNTSDVAQLTMKEQKVSDIIEVNGLVSQEQKYQISQKDSSQEERPKQAQGKE